MTIDAGSTATVSVIVDTNVGRPDFEHSITIIPETLDAKPVTVHVRGQLDMPFVSFASVLNFGEVSSWELPVTRTVYGRTLLTPVSEAQIASPYLSAKHCNLDDGRYRITVTLLADAPHGNIESAIVIQAKDGRKTRLPVLAHVCEGLCLRPEVLVLRESEMDKPQVLKVHVTAGNNEIAGTEHPPGMQVHSSALDNGEVTLTILVENPNELKRAENTLRSLRLLFESRRSIEIPIKVWP